MDNEQQSGAPKRHSMAQQHVGRDEAPASPNGGAGGPDKYVGQRMLRVEDPLLLKGKAKYTDDIHLPQMLECAFVRSPHPHARIRSVDASAALALPGVVAVYTGKDLESEVSPYIADVAREEVVGQTYRVIPIEKAVYVGQAVAAVIAESRYLAEDAVDLVEIDWEILPAVFDPEEALKPGAPRVDENIPGNNFAHVEFSNGDLDAAFAKADRVFSKRFQHGRYSAAPLEGRAVVADYSHDTGELTMWDSTQSPHVVRSAIAGPLGIAESKIRVISDYVGGGFGLKAHIYVEEAIIPALSRMVGAPVKWIEDRWEHLAASLHSKDVTCYLEAAVMDDGKILAFRGRYIGAQGGTQAYPFTSLVDGIPAACMLPGLYDIEAVGYVVDSPLVNRCTTGSYRGIGWTPGHTFREVLIDDIARGLGMDPLELRLKNTIGNDPYVSLTNMKYDGGSYKEAQLKVAEMLDYENLRKRQEELRKQGRYIGIGWSPYVECAGWGQYISTINGFPDGYFDAARVTVEPDGTVNLSTGLHNHGQAHATTFAQLAADHLGVKMEDIKVTWGDTARDIYGMGTYGSRSALIGGGAIIRATKEVREKLARMAAHALEVSPEDIEISRGVASVKGVPGKTMAVRDIASMAYFGADDRPDGEPALTSSRSYDPPETYSNGCIAAVVEVDIETGRVTTDRLVHVEDCGVMLNPLIIEGQMAGALAQGFGGAMLEELAYEENGEFLSGSLMDYLYPSTTEFPRVDVGHIETPSPITEGGIKGMAESGSIAGPAAMINAVADALAPFGVSIERMPVKPDYVRALVVEAQDRADPIAAR